MTKELRLSKAQGAAFDRDGRMTRFLRVLERWADHHGRRGYRIVSVPDPGPGTMRWRAERTVAHTLRESAGRCRIEGAHLRSECGLFS